MRVFHPFVPGRKRLANPGAKVIVLYVDHDVSCGRSHCDEDTGVVVNVVVGVVVGADAAADRHGLVEDVDGITSRTEGDLDDRCACEQP